MPPGTHFEHRDQLDAVQREIREIKGCSVLIYEQTCAAEKRRRRKRGTFPDPAKRLFISEDVCEGCGDCSVQSTCVSLMPVETDFGTKRRIDQSSCNKDYSCLSGFCPSFITVLGAEPRKPRGAKLDEELFRDLPEPTVVPLDQKSFNLMVAGIGGTGVITVAAILGMAAHLEGKAASLFDMTGLAQKNGAVFSHVRIAASPDAIHTQKLGAGETDTLIAFDLVAALSGDAGTTLAPSRTRALVNSSVTPTVAFQFDRDASIDFQLLLAQLERRVGKDAIIGVDATSLAIGLLGDTIAANMFLVGAAVQSGLLPVGVIAIERAIELNNTAVSFNLNAFHLGRLYVVNPEKIVSLLPAAKPQVPQDLDSIVSRRVEHLTAYQNDDYAKRYRDVVETVRRTDASLPSKDDSLTKAVAQNLARIMSYKDEYEVARLLSSPKLETEIKAAFTDGGKIRFNLAPPVFGGTLINGRPPKREFSAKWMLPLLRLLAKAKHLRGTALDPFGYTGERKADRALIEQYEELVHLVLGNLTPANREAAVDLLRLVEMVRGYGPVKKESLDNYRVKLSHKKSEFLKVDSELSCAA